MKKHNLNLNALKVQSFITNLNDQDAHTIYGGATIESCIICEEPAPTVGCPVETFYTACGKC
ncbi:pinensin family lanthipeptide [Fulvivirga sp. 29W222]|uniref:Pinensin family lanthipeptide n=1 Tax=Fulvivirga marina TaxID=2494733 RepID=A0A937FV46_9BACT|nr:pinensin family lanthipeptide [Fulvivirga marina]